MVPQHGEIRLTVVFTAVFLIFTFVALVIWRAERMHDRSIPLLILSITIVLVAAFGAFFQSALGLTATAALVDAGIYFGTVTAFVALKRALHCARRYHYLYAIGVWSTLANLTVGLVYSDDLRPLFWAESAVNAPVFLYLAGSLWHTRQDWLSRRLMVTIALPFALIGGLYLLRLAVMASNGDPARLVQPTGAIVLSIGLAALLSMFALVLIRNAQFSAEIVSSRAALERASASKSRFLRTMSHELRTPLGAIIGFSELLRNDDPPVDEGTRRTHAEHIHAAGLYLLNMVNDLLDLSLVEIGKLELNEEVFDPDAVFDEVILLTAGQAQNKRIDVAKRHAAAAPQIRADRRRFQQVLVNLTANALKFTDPGGQVTIGSDRRPDGGLAFFVADNGTGMTEGEIRNALTLFGQNHTGRPSAAHGMGLGLPICSEFMEAHGGRIEIESMPGEGTTVIAILPAGRAVAAASEEDPAVVSA